MKTLSENYTSICHYCGVIFKNNRSRGKHCSDHHRSLYGLHGPMINPMVRDREGEYFNVDEYLMNIYEQSKTLAPIDGWWSVGFGEESLNDLFSFYGPFPTGGYLLVLGSYVMKKEELMQDELRTYYFVKPITLLTVEEKAMGVFLSTEGKEYIK
ncbi:MAG TPA: hypothetical protein VEY10_02695 [Flavisolibacter sp.]|jgi:hypothetical protein|nr:hypothetical protein [Flavisolibacter sp.]